MYHKTIDRYLGDPSAEELVLSETYMTRPLSAGPMPEQLHVDAGPQHHDLRAAVKTLTGNTVRTSASCWP
jgi:hypothetical protein